MGSKERDVADLLTLYGVDDEQEREEFLALVRQVNVPGWWHEYGDVVPSWFEQYIGLEEAASDIRTYEVQFVPGLLQTADYARAVTRLGAMWAPERTIERRVELRMARQALLARPDAQRLWAVVDEAALRRPLGGAALMRAQLEHLIEVAERPNVTLQIAPFSVGGLAAAGGPIAVLQFGMADLPDVVYLEQLASAVYLDKKSEVDGYVRAMERLCADSSAPETTGEILKEIIRESYASPSFATPRTVARRVGSVRAASRDLTAVAGEQGGGDVHDVVSTPFGVRLLIADVMGKGLPAVRTAGTVLKAFRELAPHEAKLSGMAERMHAVLAHREPTEEFVTALFITLREEEGVAELVCCGHPAPLLLRGTGVQFVDPLPVCPPLGLLDLDDGWCESVTVPFGEDDRLLLYTDGVTEARNSDGEFYPLAERVATLLHEDPSVMVDALTGDVFQHVAGGLIDDAALLLVHSDPYRLRDHGRSRTGGHTHSRWVSR